jgi:hypothetical protein
MTMHPGQTQSCNLSWADYVNYTLRKAWKALHLIMHILKQGNNDTKRLAYTSIVRPILEYGAVCWHPYRGWQVSTLNQVQRKAANFAIIQMNLVGKLWHSTE